MDELSQLLKESAALNSKLVSLPRVQLMHMLDYAYPDGIPFRDLQSHLGMSDGKLLANIYALRDMGYLIPEDAKVENKVLTMYTLTREGHDAWMHVRQWLKRWLDST